MVVMRDGLHLATDIYRPARNGQPLDQALPVLLERTPYDKLGTNHGDRTRQNPVPRSKPELAVDFVRGGYVVALQDCRGRYGSEGVFEKYLNEGEDGYDTVDWLTAQAWCDGRVATLGLSYGAHVQSALACLAPPALAAMFLDSGGFSSAYHSGIRQGGAFELKQATWAYKHALLSPATKADPARRAALETQDLRAWFRLMPWSENHSPLSAAPEYEKYLLEQWRNGLFGPYWTQNGIYARGFYDAYVDAPMVHMSSWFDPYAVTATENYLALSARKTSPVKLIMGPWTHGQRSVTHAGDVDFGSDAPLDGALAESFVALRLAWFDAWLKTPPGPDPLPPVKLFVMGGGSGRKTPEGRLDHGGRWRDETAWPPEGVEATDYFLDVDGGLTADRPRETQAYREYVHDPLHPVPTIGGAIASGAPIMEAGAFDQREGPRFFGSEAFDRPLADRDDVLVFQTPPLEADLEVVGPIRAELHIASDCVDTDFTIKLIDVHPPSDDYPEGFAMNLTHGVLRARYREGFDHEVRLEPGQVYVLEIEAFPTANLFLKGHRIRLDVASSNFPHFDVNPNSGEPEGYGLTPRPARNRVYMDATRASRLLLPILKR
ncbi:CocE/NonD family hydrolase [Caulobacter segnis]|uniref:CocE/NonD family hydrolase n=1 Tax=Caulobacter segnis TaxID=88688 RepID=UPI001CBF0DB9|nr:CocE/NonD family hydrolase [Caulobacter segnis]UAL13109.1 CocE/NonD family hydrolase [Caulobacter segnis]